MNGFSISKKSQERLNELLQVDFANNHIAIETRLERGGDHFIYAVQLGGWIFPYQKNHPRRRYFFVRATSLQSFDNAIERAIAQIDPPLKPETIAPQ